jgi:hypothetical protein
VLPEGALVTLECLPHPLANAINARADTAASANRSFIKTVLRELQAKINELRVAALYPKQRRGAIKTMIDQ